MPPPATVEVRTRSDVHAVERAVRAAAEDAGITDAVALAGLALAASELATNLVRHARDGHVTVTAIEDDGRRGVEVRGDDLGPGIADLEGALRDGVSTRTDGLGGGFGAMRRSVDDFIIDTSPRGTHVVLRTWVPRGEVSMRIAGVSRPLPGQSHNGDDWFTWDGPHGVRVAVIDGLGHGPHAEEAAGQLRRLLIETPMSPLDHVVQAAAQRMQGGRGAVAAIIEIAGDDLTFIGVGNVEGRLCQAGREQRLMGVRGFFGAPVHEVRPLHVALEPGWTLYLYTDGISSHFPLPEGPAAREPDEVVAAILAGYARPTDDATVVLITDDLVSS